MRSALAELLGPQSPLSCSAATPSATPLPQDRPLGATNSSDPQALPLTSATTPSPVACPPLPHPSTPPPSALFRGKTRCKAAVYVSSHTECANLFMRRARGHDVMLGQGEEA